MIKETNAIELEGMINEEEDLFAKGLESELETGSVYVNELKIEEKSDGELMQLDKGEIINFKNYQVIKLKEYIASLEKEKEDLINEYKQTTEALLNRIKEIEFSHYGIRPETAKITKYMKTNNSNNSKPEIKQRCPNCTHEFPEDDFFDHSLQCLRKKFKCIKCGELMDVENKEHHLNSFANIGKCLKIVNANNSELFSQYLIHGFPVNAIVNENDNDSLIHIITKGNKPNLLSILLTKACNEIDINKVNKSKDNALIIAINSKFEECAQILIKHGANVQTRSKSDMSPLMLACKYGLLKLVELIISKGGNVNEKNILGETPLKIAQVNNHEQLALILIDDYKAEINFK